MSARSVTVVDLGTGNLVPVVRAFEHCGASVEVSDRGARIARAERLVLPGAGTVAGCIEALRDRALGQAIQDFAASRRPMLAICVGMHLLLDRFGGNGGGEGLGVIPGRAVALPARGADGRAHKVPHIGWAAVRPPRGRGRERWRGTPLDQVTPGASAYFAHAFAVEPDEPAWRLAEYDDDGQPVVAALQRGNITATQFHPEKSGPVGLRIIARFLAAAPPPRA